MVTRQEIADAPFHSRTWKTRPSAIIRYILRKVAFSFPLRKLIERPPKSPEEIREHWDALMSQSHFETYLGQTINVDSSNAMTAMMIKYHSTENPSVLDIGCAAGSLALELSCSRYLGIDVSRYAIEQGKKDGIAELQAVDVRLFETDQKWDVIVFNEVLYYLPTSEALREFNRYAEFLSSDGIICVTMKHDPKSIAIFSYLQRHCHWIDGMIWQRKYFGYDYQTRIDRECPACLLGIFQK